MLKFEDSATVAINSLVQQKILAGIKLFNLSVGEPKLLPHSSIRQAAIAALDQGKTFYPPVTGITELKIAATEWMHTTYACHFQIENCLVVNGAKFGIYLLLQQLLYPGDEVIIAAPYWVSYPAITKIFGGVPVIINTLKANNWKFTADDLKNACTTKSRILILNNAANPTGTLYSKQELKDILQVAQEKNLLVISDEVYSGLVYEDHTYVSCGSFTEYKDNVVVIQSCSKNFAMTGWRIGFVFASKIIIDQISMLISQSTSGVTTLSQWAALAAINNANEINAMVRLAMQKRRYVMMKALQNYFDLTICSPPSSLYVFVALRDLGVHSTNSVEFCQQALEQANVALVPGKAFGQEEFVRLSFGAEEHELDAGIKALAAFVL